MLAGDGQATGLPKARSLIQQQTPRPGPLWQSRLRTVGEEFHFGAKHALQR